MVNSVICARGEKARTFVPVIRALRKGSCGDVIFVDDGKNRGVWRARLAGAVIVTGNQQGKASAMRCGLSEVMVRNSGNLDDLRVIFADADLSGFTQDHARRLAEDSKGMIIGLRDNGSRWLGPVPPVTGERSLYFWDAADALYTADGYSAEMKINSFAGDHGIPVETFVMKGCTNPRKSPLKRTGQVLAAVPGHLLGLIRYVISWLRGTVRFV